MKIVAENNKDFLIKLNKNELNNIYDDLLAFNNLFDYDDTVQLMELLGIYQGDDDYEN